MPNLILTTPEFSKQSCPLPDGQFIVGRSRHCQIIINDPSVSGEHCELLIHGSEVIVRERGSRNGTFVDGARVRAQSGVGHGQQVRFGKVEALVEIEDSDDSGATAITAMENFRKVTGAGSQTAGPAVTFPVVFAAVTPGGNQDGTIDMPSSHDGSVTEASDADSARSRAGLRMPRWFFVGIGCALLGLLIFWTWTR